MTASDTEPVKAERFRVSAEAIEKLFAPSHVAVVGASPTNPRGRDVLEAFAAMGFAGKLTAVNPKYDEILGYPCVPDVASLDSPPDAVVLAVGADHVVAAFEASVEAGARAAVVFATGLGESSAGRERQRQLVDLARRADVAVVGPNCQGTINFATATPMYLGMVDAYEPGRVALISQSGSVTTALVNNRRGVRWRHVASTGNEAVVTAADLLAHHVDDPDVDVICAFLEAIRDPELFFAECDRARAAGKPVVVVKAGRSEAARAAAVAHSGALTPPDRLVDALFRRHGVLRVDDLASMLQLCVALQASPRPRGKNVALASGSGGQIELVLDECRDRDINFPEFSGATKAALQELMSGDDAITNPLDYWGMTDVAKNYPRMLDALSSDDDIDLIVAIADFSVGPTGRVSRAAKAVAAAMDDSRPSQKPVVLLDLVAGSIPHDDIAAAAPRVPLLSGLREGMDAIEALARFASPPAPRRPTVGDPARIDAFGRWLEPGVSSGHAALSAIESAGFWVAPGGRATTDAAAVELAEGIGYPVVMKAGDPELLHKTEAGGVVVGIHTTDQAHEAATTLLAKHSEVIVQKQVEGVEVLLGLQNDPDLGSFIVVGLGGIWTEILDDVAIRPVGLAVGEAERMVEGLRGSALLAGARNTEPRAVEDLVRAIELLDDIALAVGPRLREVDINPLIVGTTHATAVDAVVSASSASSAADDRQKGQSA